MLPLRLLRAAAALVIVVAATACDGPRTRADLPSAQRSFSLFALTGAPTGGPTAILFFAGTGFPAGRSVIADAAFNFEVAFDIDANGGARLYPARTLAGGLSSGGVKRVGLQLVSGTFEQLREAPETGYDTLGFKPVQAGSVVAIEMFEANACFYSLGGINMYAKLVVDSIRPSERRIFGRTVYDRNCGFRELVADSIPGR